jgi:hypothetical protein
VTKDHSQIARDYQQAAFKWLALARQAGNPAQRASFSSPGSLSFPQRRSAVAQHQLMIFARQAAFMRRSLN